jgi:transposase-like protein
MKKRNWTGREKLEIVLEGLKGATTLAERCNRHQITQGQFYQWRDRLMEEGAKLFARGGVDKEAERLKAENRRLTQAVGELTMELKKNDW